MAKPWFLWRSRSSTTRRSVYAPPRFDVNRLQAEVPCPASALPNAVPNASGRGVGRVRATVLAASAPALAVSAVWCS
jgi:hypothetical protein